MLLLKSGLKIMNIKSLTNHIAYSKIFEGNINKTNNKPNWYKIARTPNLPVGFIDKYFFQFYKYGIEKHQSLNEYLINKYGHWLNWNLLLHQQNVNEKLIEKFLYKINYITLAKTQRLSMKFIKKYAVNLRYQDLEVNEQYTQEELYDIKSLLLLENGNQS